MLILNTHFVSLKQKIRLKDLKFKKLRLRRIRYRTLLIFFGIFATVLIGFNFWFIDHSEEALENLVYTQSRGKLRLKVNKFKFNWINNKIELQGATFYTTDSTAATTTRLNTPKITIKAKGFLPLLIKNHLLIDSIHLFSPDILIIRNMPREKKNVRRDSTAEKFSVAKEMGRITASINEAINVLKINRFILDNGSFSLIDKTKPDEAPFLVNKINIRLDNLQVDSSVTRKAAKKVAFTDDIAIQTSDQKIIFPGGRHVLNFKNFKFTLKNKRVEFDSCTIRANKGDSSKSAFTIFFNKLQLTNINFDTLYQAEVIQADSVFCTNPKIFLNIDGDRKTIKKNKKKIQNIDELVQQLIGDVMLNYVVVKNADININTIKKGKTSAFSATKNNFEIQGLNVRQNYERPVHVTRFIMALHNYETTLQDGRYAIAFDSVLFNDNAIRLDKFSFKEFGRNGIVKSVSMPNFQLRGLSWESLFYDNIFNANTAQFYKPTIFYATGSPKASQSKNVFETLADIGKIMNLTNLNILNGNITLNLNKGATLKLENTDLTLLADELTSSKKIKNIQHSIQTLFVKKGIFNKGATSATLNNIRLIENNNGISASGLILKDAGLNAKANDIRLNSIILDSANQTISINGLKWANAHIYINNNNTKGKTKNTPPKTNLSLRNISGNNSTILIQQADKKISAYLSNISIDEVLKKINKKTEIKGLKAIGQNLLMESPNQHFSIASLNVSDKNNSIIRDIHFRKFDDIDSIIINIPQIAIIPDITRIASGNITLNNIVLNEPEIFATLGHKDTVLKNIKKTAPEINLGTALLQRPKIQLTLINKNYLPSYITWNGIQEKSFIKLTDFHSTQNTPIDAKTVQIYLTNFEYTNVKGKRTATNDNKLNLLFNDVLVQKNETGATEWKTNANILSLDKLYFDNLGKKNAVLKLDKGDVRNIILNSKYVNTVGDIIKNSENLKITGTNGSFISVKNQVDWYNLGMHKKYFNVDSFTLRPLQSIEDYKIKKDFEEDYLAISSGVVNGGPVDLVKYQQDSILSIGTVELNNVNLLTLKDKRQEGNLKKFKPLPTSLILKIPTKLNIDSMRLKNMYVQYWEINPKTDTTGIIGVSNLNASISNIRNYNLQNNDSLYIHASANVINNLFTALHVKESYKDSLNTFLLKLTTGPISLLAFNNLLLPLVGARAKSGYLDSLRLQAIGNDNYSLGTMQMYYQNLKMQLMNKKDLQKQSFINKIISWLANTFIIRKNNYGKMSPAFFERIKEKSAINFYIKTTLSGIKSGIGLPGVKSKQKRYLRKSLTKNQPL